MTQSETTFELNSILVEIDLNGTYSDEQVERYMELSGKSKTEVIKIFDCTEEEREFIEEGNTVIGVLIHGT